MKRRDFIRDASGFLVASPALASEIAIGADSAEAGRAATEISDGPNGTYDGERLSRVAFPMGGIGAGMICMEGAGALTSFSLHHHPDLLNEPCVFAAVSIQKPNRIARVLEGPVPRWKMLGWPNSTAAGAWGRTWGWPRMSEVHFQAKFPFGSATLKDPEVPLSSTVTGWSPFEPGNSHDASLPVIAMEYTFANESTVEVEAVFSFHSVNFMKPEEDNAAPGFRNTGTDGNRITSIRGGFLLHGAGTTKEPWHEGSCAIWTDDTAAKVNHAWLRSSASTQDAFRVAWQDIETGACYDRPPITEGTSSPGASLFVPFRVPPGQSTTISVRFAWYVPNSDLRSLYDAKNPGPAYKPWYASQFADLKEIISYWDRNYEELKRRSQRFSNCLYSSTLPPEVMSAVTSNLSILKSPTLLRQTDGRLWAWEGSGEKAGDGGPGSCTHVWNYAQALAHLFPDLERSLRATEFGSNQGVDGYQAFRAALPIRPIGDTKEGREVPPAADGQLGGILKAYRDWRICGDTSWLAALWPKIRRSLHYCISTWDPKHNGHIEEPHLNTYDVQFWGSDGMHASIYSAALNAAIHMGQALSDDISFYQELLAKVVRSAETDLFNGEFFIQNIAWKTLQSRFPGEYAWDNDYSTEARELADKEGPHHQYGHGCLSDGVFGQWLSVVCGLDQTLDVSRVKSHLMAVYRYNLKHDLSSHANPLRATLACGSEGGLVLCTWPKGHPLTLPFPYCDEVWTGVEYQVASHMIMTGLVDQGLDIISTCRARYDGSVRNPFDEYECGHWYGRALSSYSLLQALSGARYDAVDKTLYLRPRIKGDFRCFLSTATGYGSVGVTGGRAFVEVESGIIPYAKLDYVPAT